VHYRVPLFILPVLRIKAAKVVVACLALRRPLPHRLTSRVNNVPVNMFLVSLDDYSVLLVIAIDYKIYVQLEEMSNVFKTDPSFIRCYC